MTYSSTLRWSETPPTLFYASFYLFWIPFSAYSMA